MSSLLLLRDGAQVEIWRKKSIDVYNFTLNIIITWKFELENHPKKLGYVNDDIYLMYFFIAFIVHIFY